MCVLCYCDVLLFLSLFLILVECILVVVSFSYLTSPPPFLNFLLRIASLYVPLSLFLSLLILYLSFGF